MEEYSPLSELEMAFKLGHAHVLIIYHSSISYQPDNTLFLYAKASMPRIWVRNRSSNGELKYVCIFNALMIDLISITSS